MKTDLSHLRIYYISVFHSPNLVKKTPIEGYRVIIPEYEDYEFFTHKNLNFDDGLWQISEATTGFCLPETCRASTREQAILNATNTLEAIGKLAFKRAINRAKNIIKSPDLVEKLNASK